MKQYDKIAKTLTESDKHAVRMAMVCAIEGFTYLTLAAKFMRRVPRYKTAYEAAARIIEDKILVHLPYVLNTRIANMARACGWNEKRIPPGQRYVIADEAKNDPAQSFMEKVAVNQVAREMKR